MIQLSEREWKPIRTRLKEEYKFKPSVMLIREVMRRELGFTIRYHADWMTDTDGRNVHREMVCLDFYDDALETMFRLKYL